MRVRRVIWSIALQVGLVSSVVAEGGGSWADIFSGYKNLSSNAFSLFTSTMQSNAEQVKQSAAAQADMMRSTAQTQADLVKAQARMAQEQAATQADALRASALQAQAAVVSQADTIQNAALQAQQDVQGQVMEAQRSAQQKVVSYKESFTGAIEHQKVQAQQRMQNARSEIERTRVAAEQESLAMQSAVYQSLSDSERLVYAQALAAQQEASLLKGRASHTLSEQEKAVLEKQRAAIEKQREMENLAYQRLTNAEKQVVMRAQLAQAQVASYGAMQSSMKDYLTAQERRLYDEALQMEREASLLKEKPYSQLTAKERVLYESWISAQEQKLRIEESALSRIDSSQKQLARDLQKKNQALSRYQAGMIIQANTLYYLTGSEVVAYQAAIDKEYQVLGGVYLPYEQLTGEQRRLYDEAQLEKRRLEKDALARMSAEEQKLFNRLMVVHEGAEKELARASQSENSPHALEGSKETGAYPPVTVSAPVAGSAFVEPIAPVTAPIKRESLPVVKATGQSSVSVVEGSGRSGPARVRRSRSVYGS